MNSATPVTLGSRALFAALLVAVLLVTSWVLWPGIHGPELLDDRTSVAVLVELQDNPERAWDFVFGDRSGTFGRSVTMITFVLERLYLDAGTVGNKRVNIVLHCLNGALVVWMFALLFRARQIPATRWLALLLGAVWLLHPLQVSTVLYVVQRMAMMATLFMLLALIAYLYWRSRIRRGDYQLFWLLPTLVFIALGALAKENALLVVPVILLIEALWFQCRDDNAELLVPLQRITWALIAGGTLAALVLFALSYDVLQSKYHHRPFTLEERALTQGRLLWDYVGQWYAPQVQRMGIYHDDTVWSTSFTSPASTLWAWLGWGAVALVSLIALRWTAGRLLVLGVGWYLAGHLMESTVWPLELYFEHRNYFPALGLLLLVGVLYSEFARRWPEAGPALLACLVVWPLVLSMMTSSQAQIWSSRPLLILQHVNGHPESARANTDMAAQMAELGAAERALYYSRRAQEASHVERDGDRAVRDIALLCIARAPILPQHIEQVGAEDARRPLGSVATLSTLVSMVQDNQCPTMDRQRFSDHMASIYLQGDRPATASPNMYGSLAVLENALQQYERAFAYTEKMLALKPRRKRGLLMQLHFATALGREAVVAELVNTLQAMDRDGKLTVGERQTLELYLEN